MKSMLSKDPSAPRVAVIDDDIFHLRFCEKALGNDYRLSCHAMLSEEAQRDAAVADCIILDLDMQPLDGLAFLNSRGSSRVFFSGKKQHLIICSAMGNEILNSAKSIALSNGFTGVAVLQKPVSKQLLCAELESWTGLRSTSEKKPTVSRPIDLPAVCQALDNGDIKPAWQPQIEVKSKAVTGFEVLARWRLQDRSIPPSDFIPLIEHSPLSIRFSLYMLDAALRSLKRWRNGAAYQGLLSVNMPAGILDHPSLHQRIAYLLKIHQFPPRRLVIEVTETMDLTQRVVMHTTLTRLKMLGVQLSIDDFGMGYSNIERLSTGLFSEIKIDAHFVKKMTSSSQVQNVIAGIIDGARRCGVRVVAEGVESESSARVMEQLGCTHFQGALFSMAMSEAEAGPWLRARGTRPAAGICTSRTSAILNAWR